jgi:hypothetical protein
MFKNFINPLFMFLFIAVIAVSCDDSSPTSPEEHIDAEGFVLENNETIVYREFEGKITVNDIALTNGATLELSVHFLDHDGNELEHEDEDGEEETLTFDIVDSAVISVVTEAHEDEDGHGDEHHELGFELTGLSVGTTTFTFSLMHEGHADYTSLPLSVTVNSAMFSCNSKQLCLRNCCESTIYASK